MVRWEPLVDLKMNESTTNPNVTVWLAYTLIECIGRKNQVRQQLLFISQLLRCADAQ